MKAIVILAIVVVMATFVSQSMGMFANHVMARGTRCAQAAALGVNLGCK